MAGLVLTRRVGEKVRLQLESFEASGQALSPVAVWVEVDSIGSGGQVRLRFLAPEEVVIQRGEHVFDGPFEVGPPAYESMRNGPPPRPPHAGYPTRPASSR